MTQRIILRYPDGESLIEADDKSVLIEHFVNWVIEQKHFTDHHKTDDEITFVFPKYSYVSVCNIKWRRLCSS